MKKRLLVISADAMVTEDLPILSGMTNFRKYLAGGVSVSRVRSIYPTLTYPAHVSILTGCLPHKTGITNNHVFSADLTCRRWEWDARRIQVSDIFTAAKKKGYSTASILWPVTGNHPDIDYLINEYWLPEPGETLESAFRKEGSSDEILRILRNKVKYLSPDWRQGGADHFAVHPLFDEFGVQCACKIIRSHAPEVLFVHTSPLDNIRHRYGVFSDHLVAEIRRVDRQIGSLCRALEEAGVLEKTNIVLLSDHGQLNTVRSININVLLRREHLLDVKADGTLADDWKACCIEAGMCAYVYLQDPQNKQLYERIFRFLNRLKEEGVYGISEVMPTEEADQREGLSGSFSFVLETDGYTAFSNACTGPVATTGSLPEDYHYLHGKHGYLPDKGPQPVFVARGPDFQENTQVPFCRLIDEAPTFARLLGVDLPEAEGTCIAGLLK